MGSVSVKRTFMLRCVRGGHILISCLTPALVCIPAAHVPGSIRSTALEAGGSARTRSAHHASPAAHHASAAPPRAPHSATWSTAVLGTTLGTGAVHGLSWPGLFFFYVQLLVVLTVGREEKRLKQDVNVSLLQIRKSDADRCYNLIITYIVIKS